MLSNASLETSITTNRDALIRSEYDYAAHGKSTDGQSLLSAKEYLVGQRRFSSLQVRGTFRFRAAVLDCADAFAQSKQRQSFSTYLSLTTASNPLL